MYYKKLKVSGRKKLSGILGVIGRLGRKICSALKIRLGVLEGKSGFLYVTSEIKTGYQDTFVLRRIPAADMAE